MTTKKVGAIIQARINSTRLPRKVLLPLAGKTSLWWTVQRARQAKLVDSVIIATTNSSDNNRINYHAINQTFHDFDVPEAHRTELIDFEIYRYGGDENDVINRVLCAAKEYDIDIIVDITGDCNVIDFYEIDVMVDAILKDESLDYVSNVMERTFCDGLDIQVYKTESLQRLIRMHNPQTHVGWNFIKHKSDFNTLNFKAPAKYNHPEICIVLDCELDYILMKQIFNKFGHTTSFKSTDVVDYLLGNPKLLSINNSVKRKDPEKEG